MKCFLKGINLRNSTGMAEEMAAIVKHHVGTHARGDWLNGEGKFGFKCPHWEWGSTEGKPALLKTLETFCDSGTQPLGKRLGEKGLEFSLLPTHCSPSMTAGTDLGSSFRVDLLGLR